MNSRGTKAESDQPNGVILSLVLLIRQAEGGQRMGKEETSVMKLFGLFPGLFKTGID
jgi:hypothetical protein